MAKQDVYAVPSSLEGVTTSLPQTVAEPVFQSSNSAQDSTSYDASSSPIPSTTKRYVTQKSKPTQ